MSIEIRTRRDLLTVLGPNEAEHNEWKKNKQIRKGSNRETNAAIRRQLQKTFRGTDLGTQIENPLWKRQLRLGNRMPLKWDLESQIKLWTLPKAVRGWTKD